MHVCILEYHVHIKCAQFHTPPLKYEEYSICCYLVFVFILFNFFRQGVTSPDWPATGHPPAPASLGMELQS